MERENAKRNNSFDELDSEVVNEIHEKDSDLIKVGICAMEKKSKCGPMTEILNRLNVLKDFDFVFFPESTILNEPIEDWPVVDCLISFYSDGFPLKKAQAYVNLRKPFLINDLKLQERLLWRHKVYETLVRHSIPTPKNFVLIRDPKLQSVKEAYASEIEDEDPDKKIADENVTKIEPYATNRDPKKSKVFLDEREFTLERLNSANSNSSTSIEKTASERSSHGEKEKKESSERSEKYEKLEKLSVEKKESNSSNLSRDSLQKEMIKESTKESTPSNQMSKEISITKELSLSNPSPKESTSLKEFSLSNNTSSKESPIKKASDKEPGFKKEIVSTPKPNQTSMEEIINHLKSNIPTRKGSEAKSMNNTDACKDILEDVETLRKETTIPIAINMTEKNPSFEMFKEKQKSQNDIVIQNRKSKKNLKPRKVKRKLSEISPHRDGQFFMDDLTENFLLDPYFGYKSKYYIDVIEHEDYLEFGGEKLKKPFVEKPLNAENHNINIYYPVNDGGGCKKLFRKTQNVASNFEKNTNQIRKEGCYIYEAFLPTEGFDIKVYTVGPNYAHAETRKAPVLDGVVQRTREGKEVRYPVNLTYEEKLIAKKIVIAFGQNVCGFDLLRSKGKSYVCDVNGWSFVKGSNKYYADCAILLRDMILARFAPHRINPLAPHPILYNKNHMHMCDDPHLFRPKSNEGTGLKEELRSVVAIFRHGDRKPKQKMKMITTDPRFLEFFNSSPDNKKEITLKSAKLLEKFLEITDQILLETNKYDPENDIENEKLSKHLQLYSVLKQSEQFEGINRKIQLKPLAWEEKKIGDKVFSSVTQALLILKWGGELTHTGIDQAEALGTLFRDKVYPHDNEGLLRLHSTYRHDLKIYSSEEGRCQKTAAAFTKGLLELEGDIPPILVSLVRKDEVTQELLDFNKTGEDSLTYQLSKNLVKIMNSDKPLYDSVKEIVEEEHIDSNMKTILDNIGVPITLLKQAHELIKEITSNTRKILAIKKSSYYLNPKDFDSIAELPNEASCEEPMILTFKRWRKLEIDFYKKKEGIYDVSKIPDVHYSIRYDVLHSKHFYIQNKETCHKLLECVGKLAKFIIPAEYGLRPQDKVNIGVEIVSKLLHKIKHDLIWWNSPYLNKAEGQVIEDEHCFLQHRGLDITKLGDEIKSSWRHVRTRLYFTSASHLYTLFNVISLGVESSLININQKELLKQMTSMDYLSNILIRLYETLDAKPEDPNRFRLEILVSQGCDMDQAFDQDYSKVHSVPIAPHIMLNSQLNLKEIEDFFDNLFKVGKDSTPTISPEHGKN